jgi:hypothetical protein
MLPHAELSVVVVLRLTLLILSFLSRVSFEPQSLGKESAVG